MTIKSSNDFFRNLAIHVIIWLLVIQFIFDVSGVYESFLVLWEQEDFIFDEAFLLIPLMILLFYGNRNVLIPYFLNQQSWGKYLIAALASLVIFQGIGYGLAIAIENSDFYFDQDLDEIFNYILFFNVMTLAVSSSLGISQIALTNAAQRKEAEAQQKAMELKYLANQFKPHFLYNTLNGLYAKALEENAPETAEAIVRLSEIMRYPINQGLKKSVPLAEEVKFIEDYIALQRIRLGNDYPIYFEKEGNLEGIDILPLSLIVLVENSFKYGVSQKKKSPIVFQLKVNDDSLYFSSENQLKPLSANSSSLNIGLDNLRKRLALNKGNDFVLKTKIKEDRYFVDLKL